MSFANHSYTHPILASMSEGAIRDQLEKTHQAVLSATGVTMKLLRPPYGALSQPATCLGPVHFGLQNHPLGCGSLGLEISARRCPRGERDSSHAKSGSIILSHDIHKTTVDAMPSTLDALTAKGFKFVTVSELLALDRPSAPKTPPASKATTSTSNSKEKAPKKSRTRRRPTTIKTPKPRRLQPEAPAQQRQAAPRLPFRLPPQRLQKAPRRPNLPSPMRKKSAKNGCKA
jgi:hypothetical protein